MLAMAFVESPPTYCGRDRHPCGDSRDSGPDGLGISPTIRPDWPYAHHDFVSRGGSKRVAGRTSHNECPCGRPYVAAGSAAFATCPGLESRESTPVARRPDY